MQAFPARKGNRLQGHLPTPDVVVANRSLGNPKMTAESCQRVAFLAKGLYGLWFQGCFLHFLNYGQHHFKLFRPKGWCWQQLVCVGGVLYIFLCMRKRNEFSTLPFPNPLGLHRLSVLVPSLVPLDTCHCNWCQSDLCLSCLGWMCSVPCALITLSCSQRPSALTDQSLPRKNCQLYWAKSLHHLVLVCLPNVQNGLPQVHASCMSKCLLLLSVHINYIDAK